MFWPVNTDVIGQGVTLSIKVVQQLIIQKKQVKACDDWKDLIKNLLPLNNFGKNDRNIGNFYGLKTIQELCHPRTPPTVLDGSEISLKKTVGFRPPQKVRPFC
jgi:hypothetical protein